MSVLVVTSLGDITIDLYTDQCPLTCKNFLKLCKIKYYNGCLFHTVQKDFTAQTGDPTGTGAGGDSVYKFLYGDQARFFSDEIHHDLKHSKKGTVAMASAGENLNASQFYITLRDDLDYLDGKHTIFGWVAEGDDTLTRINEAYVDEKNRPYKNIRVKHTYVLYDPFDDPSQLAELIPDASPEGKPKDEVDDEVRLEDDWEPLEDKLGPAELEEVLRAKDAHSSAVVLETIGDIPDAEIKPPENVLFVCKLNPVTEDEDLHTIFSRFGTVTSADIIRDYKTGDSLCYAFIATQIWWEPTPIWHIKFLIVALGTGSSHEQNTGQILTKEFETKEACEQAYFKMDNALIDDRRIHVDFSQSVAKLWNQYRRKNNQMGKGGSGCFKCGSPGHMAKDCTGGPGTNQPSKYILKDDNRQRGGESNSRYEMVFDGETPENRRQDDSRRRHDADNQSERQRTYRSSEHRRERDQERNKSSDGHLQSDRRRYRDYEMHSEERSDREKYVEKRKDRHEEGRDDRAYRKKSADIEGHRDGRDNGGYKKRTVDDGPDDRDYKKRRADERRRCGDDERQDTRDVRSHRDHDGYKGRMEGREHRREGRETNDRDRRDRGR